jgi:hypothetical protein
MLHRPTNPPHPGLLPPMRGRGSKVAGEARVSKEFVPSKYRSLPMCPWRCISLCVLGLLVLASLLPILARSEEPKPVENPTSNGRYELRQDHDPNGIGKFCLGREIAHVMGFGPGGQGAEWLERAVREKPVTVAFFSDHVCPPINQSSSFTWKRVRQEDWGQENEERQRNGCQTSEFSEPFIFLSQIFLSYSVLRNRATKLLPS